MNSAVRLALSVYEFAASAQVRKCLRQIHRELDLLVACSDEEIVARCSRLIDSPKLPESGMSRSSFSWLRGRDLTDHDAELIALTAEAFSRFPPDGIPRGTRLYEHQLLAAVHMLRGTLVQMDTGEGKTFALAISALALLRTHAKVYIVTANPYLAARDAVNTEPFWEALGVPLGLAVGNDPGSDPWRARVVYTTLDTLVFRSLEEDLGRPPQLQWSALLIDEADAILLDASPRQFQISRYTDDPTKDWSAPLQIAASLDEDDFEIHSASYLSAQLTASGEAAVTEMAGLTDRPPDERLSMFGDVEQAYIATQVAKSGHDYVVRENAVVTIDPSSGWHTPGIRHGWVAPLEMHLGLPSSPHRSLLQFTDGIAVLRRFRHLAGASGTIIDEALEYALLLGLPPAIIPPRTPRTDGRLPDVIALSREVAHDWVVDQVVRFGAKRPVLVATDSTAEAEQIAQLLEAANPEGVQVHLVTDETIAAERIFERAGQPGVTIVSTRVSGRGVDIQLSSEARNAGGPVLLAVGHSSTARIDRQLLGRVGRQGDPFEARFVNHPEDPLMSSGAIPAHLIEQIIDTLAVDDTIEASVLSRQLASAQRRVRRWQLQVFASSVGFGNAREEATEMLRHWRQSLGHPQEGEGLPEGFVTFLADRFLTTCYPALSEKGVSGRLVRAVAEGIVEMTGDSNAVALDLIGKATGQPTEEVRKVFRNYLEESLRRADAANEKAREELKQRRLAIEENAMHLRLRALSDGLNRNGLDDGARPMLEIAIAASNDNAAVAVSQQTLQATLAQASAVIMEKGRDGLSELVAAGERSVLPLEEEPDPCLERWAQRSSWKIASETVCRGSRHLETSLDRANFRVRQMTNGPRTLVAFKDEVESLRLEVEATLARDACENLLAGADPPQLDELFADIEHAVAVASPRLQLTLPALSTKLTRTVDSVEPPIALGIDALIAEYAAAVRENLSREPNEEDRLIAALRQLIGPAGLPPLGNPDVVAERYRAWKRGETRWKEIPPWRWRFADRFVSGFLAFLHERGLAASLPQGLPQRSRSLARRTWKRIATPTFGLGAMMFAGAFTVALVLALAPAPSGGLHLGIGPAFLDSLLTAGALGAGSALAPAVLALTTGLWIRLLEGIPITRDAGVAGSEQAISVLLVGTGAVMVVLPWNHEFGGGLLLSLLAVAVLVGANLFVTNGIYRFEQMTHFHAVPLLAAACAAFSTVPLLIGIDGSGPVLAVVLLAGTVNLASRPLRQARIPALALRIDEHLSVGRESLEVKLPVAGRLSVVHHAFALAFAWTFSCLLLGGGVGERTAVAGGAYLVVLAIWAGLLARLVTNPADWQKRMRGRHQTYSPPTPGATLPSALHRARMRVFLGELAFACIVVALGASLSRTASTGLLEQLPLGMAAIFLAIVITDLGSVFFRGVAATQTSVTGDLVQTGEADEDGMIAAVKALVGQCARWMSGVIVVILALHEIADLVGLGEFFVQIYEFARKLF